ncbi:uncharacterized protein LOC115733285 [Rhodamnia argentea]|uniref:Uncharacterized protein LOC115733285 n=1 Tax=Rhodamnia argentea TaxID=178133 RepID=A0A8B8NBL7_9MYRT|nr:uncharacterized protein LOC115733285 [Rhodamnia argentea]XP_030519837.2 uncharacterized protein LOC115733285 [Rhodamnia argentea]XP_048142049.1 uncharacterized protein LOC115733285 [Rhodamnia argentea]XP_048142050.1 uncharacterized protein LOC115733285 [Rhodamnia argentea]XP_048142051.1 uncharacterized protein LOC115733285 [Rhodamnia argentea]XP_048142052.1 uncharacterized protein LOC115733285 [Rhodamnia argentea]XP_048142053.1 uncharacterized protein LOC115733285 [Rhodamnia argentea]XP_0
MESNKKRTPNTSQNKRSERSDKKNQKPRQENGVKGLNAKQTDSKTSIGRSDSCALVGNSRASTEPAEVYEDLVIHYVDDVNRTEDPNCNLPIPVLPDRQNKDETLDNHSSDLEKESWGKEEGSDTDTVKDSVSSQGDSVTPEEDKVERSSKKVVRKINKTSITESSPLGSRRKIDQENNKSQSKALQNTSGKSTKCRMETSGVANESLCNGDPGHIEVPSKPSSESSEGVDDKSTEEMKELDILDEASHGTQSVGSDSDASDAGENECKDQAALEQKIGEMEMRIEKLEEELREVAALEISLYSVVPEHGSSAHKVHTPARRLSRLYIHACKHWTQDKRATIAKNIVSGLVLIAKSCSNDVPRLTFWLSNTIVLREIISQAFGSSRNSSPFTKFAESNGSNKKSEAKSMTLKWKGNSNFKQTNGCIQFLEDWQETGTFTGALEKAEMWIFSRIVESIWWQAFTPHMQTPVEDSFSNKSKGKLLGPALGDQQQGNFSINLWTNAFQDAFQQICPVRAARHECGCLPVLARMVMEQCVARLDVAMFNAILRESAFEIPTDPVSDPIVDSTVLPIPAGHLSFGSGAQLKNSVGNWSRWLSDMFGMDNDNPAEEDQQSHKEERQQGGNSELKSFLLLNELSELLMLPKDLIMDRSIRKEVCPTIGLALVKRVLCNFTPDEFCPDPVPGAVLEALNAESIVEWRFSGETVRNFPYTATPVTYYPPSSLDVAEKVAEAGVGSHLSRNVSAVQRKGYTSDEELEDLESPLMSIMDSMCSSPTTISNGNGNGKLVEHPGYSSMNARYELLREVWSE